MKPKFTQQRKRDDGSARYFADGVPGRIFTATPPRDLVLSSGANLRFARKQQFSELSSASKTQSSRLFARKLRVGWSVWGDEVAAAYDANADFAGSLNDFAIRERVAAGGKGWEPR